MTFKGILKGVAAGAFVLSLPVLFGTVTLRWLVSDVGWYQAGFSKYGVSERTRIAPDELARVAQQMSNYLLLGQNNIDISVEVAGQKRPLFNQRELVHMADVQALFGKFYTLQGAAAAYALLYLLTSRFWLRGDYRRAIGNGLRWGGGLTIGLFGAIGVLSLLDFDQFWPALHRVFFANDFWMLDPSRDYLIMLVPEGFWYDTAVRFAQATCGQALAAILLGSLLARKQLAGSQ